MRLSGPLTTDWMSWNTVVLNYKWSQDNSVEIEKGWIKRADIIRALAMLIDRDPNHLEEVINNYNEMVRKGKDEKFGRNKDRMAQIIHPPFYAVEIVPAIVACTGGGKRNSQSQVLDFNGNPIPRLYEVGEMGSMISNIYQNGSFLTECMISGQIAGREVIRIAG